ncbi:MAG: YIP1 family protein [Pseudomonadota bacterium]
MTATVYPASTNVVATYRRGPGVVMRRLLALGQREDRALIFLMVACVIMFVAQLPRISREATLGGYDAGPFLQAAALAWILIAPLVLYLIAPVSRLIGMVLGGQGTWYGARLALFWALLAASPVHLLLGLTAGFIGEGIQMTLMGVLWLAVFLWFWIGGAIAQERRI